MASFILMDMAGNQYQLSVSSNDIKDSNGNTMTSIMAQGNTLISNLTSINANIESKVTAMLTGYSLYLKNVSDFGTKYSLTSAQLLALDINTIITTYFTTAGVLMKIPYEDLSKLNVTNLAVPTKVTGKYDIYLHSAQYMMFLYTRDGKLAYSKTYNTDSSTYSAWVLSKGVEDTTSDNLIRNQAFLTLGTTSFTLAGYSTAQVTSYIDDTKTKAGFVYAIDTANSKVNITTPGLYMLTGYITLGYNIAANETISATVVAGGVTCPLTISAQSSKLADCINLPNITFPVTNTESISIVFNNLGGYDLSSVKVDMTIVRLSPYYASAINYTP